MPYTGCCASGSIAKPCGCEGFRNRPPHILDAISRITEYTDDGRQAFVDDGKTQDAVIRNLEIIGEAVKALPAAARSAEPDIPWKQIAGMRDKLIHAYFGVDLELVWEVVEHRLPPLQGAVQRLLDA